jgi:VanZ family protein
LFEYLEQKKIILIYVPLAIYWIALLIGTSLPTVSVPSVAFGDKIAHFAAYLILSALLSLSLLFQNKNDMLKSKHTIWAFIIVSFYGGLDEIHQGFIPGRSQDIFDWLADSIGALAGVLFLLYLLKRNGYIAKESQKQN